MSALAKIKSKFGDKVSIEIKSPQRAYLKVEKAEAHELIRYMFQDLEARFSIASGIDVREGVEILYHMAFDKESVMATVKVLVKKPELSMPTLTDFMPAADWIEREIHEMLGVDFPGHKNLKQLLLPDDWPEGVYPLRKSFTLNQLKCEDKNG